VIRWASAWHLCSIAKTEQRSGEARPGGDDSVVVMTEDSLLRIDGVCVSFGGLDVLSDVSIDMPSGVLGVIGPNGAGKTTLFNVICGFVRPRQGSMTFAGKPLRGHRPHDLADAGIARTLQGLGLFSRLTVLENVIAGTTHRSRTGPIGALLASPWAQRDERRLRADALEVMASLGIADDADRMCASLPYGGRKRVALARALVSQPRLLMLDEPAAGLSAPEMSEVADIIRGLRGRTAVMLVEHNMDFVMDLCESLVVLDFGQVIARGTPTEVRNDPAVQRAYLGEPIDTTAPVGGDHA
jgi:branched-chain amino acid transport system ATP-binding protein